MTKSLTSSQNSVIDRRWRFDVSWKWVAFAVVFWTAVTFLGCGEAYGQHQRQPGDPCPGDMEGPRRKTLEWDGTRGVWFRADVARCLLGDVKSIPRLNVQIELLERKAENQADEIDLRNEAVRIAIEESQIATGTLEAAIRGQRLAEEKLDHWSRSRLLWASVGAVAGFALVYLAVQIVDSDDGGPPPPLP